jgi:hypothetical protein
MHGEVASKAKGSCLASGLYWDDEACLPEPTAERMEGQRAGARGWGGEAAAQAAH